MTRRILWVVGMVLISYSLKAQYKIGGTVLDKETKRIEFVSVNLQQRDSTIAQTITDSFGNFMFDNIKNGLYNLELEYWGNIKNQSIEIINNNMVLNIEFDSIAQYMDEVIVEAKKPIIEKKIDRLVFNVENSITSVGGSALDALTKTPYVQVRNNFIGLIGKSGVAIMVDDKLIQLSGEDLINYLQSIKSEDISKIEVITNPTAKYDAEGNSGLINIVLKKAKRNELFSGNIFTALEKRTYFSNSSGLGLNYRKNKIYISTGLNGNIGKTAPTEEFAALYIDRELKQISDRTDYRKNIAARFLIEYDISEKSKIGFQYLGGYSRPDVKENIRSHYLTFAGNDSTLKTYAYKNTQSAFSSFNLNYNSKLDDKGKKMFFDINYLINSNTNERPFDSKTYNQLGELINGSSTGNRNNGIQHISIFASKLDFEIPNKIANLSFGTKVSFMTNKSNNAMYELIGNEYVIDNRQSDTFEYREQIQALYFTLSKAIKKWEFQFGLRGENTQTKSISLTYDTTTQKNYFKTFPTAYINYTPNDENVFSLNYGRRIGRPTYRWLNPFRWYSNKLNYSEGNPFLQPTYLNNFEFSHLYKNKLNSTLFFTYQTNGYNQLAFADNSSDIFYFKPINFFTEYSIGLTEYYQFEIGKTITTTAITNIYHTITSSDIPITDKVKSMTSANIQLQNSFLLNKSKTLFAELNAWYQLPQTTGLLNERSSGSVDLGMKYLLLNKKLTVSLNISDIFKTSYNRYYNTINGIEQNFKNYYDNRYIRLSINYNFGNKSIRNKNQSQSNDEERRRI